MTSKAVAEVPKKEARNLSLAPKDMNEAMAISKIIAASEACPREMRGKPETVFVAICLGREVGFGAMQSVQNIYVVNGRPTIFGDGALGLIQNSGLLAKFEEYKPTQALKEGKGRCLIQRKGKKECVYEFTMEQAKTAGLWGKEGPWRNYPGRMFQMRARSLALRDEFADVLKGLAIREEIEDYVDTVAVPIPEPQPLPEQGGKVEEPPAETAKCVSEQQRKLLFATIKDSGIAHDSLKNYLSAVHGVESTKDIPTEKFEEVLAWAKVKA